MVQKIGRFKSLKFTYEWRQQMWWHNLTFGDILLAILIGLMFGIFRKELNLPNYSKLTKIATLW